MKPTVAAALAEHQRGHGLPRAFAMDLDIYERELAVIWRGSWLFAGPSAQARHPGDFFLFEPGDDSLVIVRDGANRVHALHNTCRHRGMRVCNAAQGNVARLRCPYHQWTYALDGRLLHCGGMEDQLAPADYGLSAAAVTEVGGLIFVWCGPEPEPMTDADAELATALAPQGLEHRARVAHQIDYAVRANWKLVWENNRECWHCHAGHPEYIRANFDTAPDTEPTRALVAARARDHAQVLGTYIDHLDPGLYPFPTPNRWWSANRTALAPGYVTESIDGEPVAPLMGDYRGYDVGTLRAPTVPNFWCHASADHAVLTRLAPAGPERTKVRVQWLVDRDAVEGRDYHLDRLLPFWRLTSEQDWSLCERNHAGIRSPAFIPGPYSRRHEANLLAFVDWYLSRLKGG